MLDSSNEKLLVAISTLLSEGKIDAEAAGKLLNTAARFEERVQAVSNNTLHSN